MALVWLRRRGCCQPPYVVHPDRVCTGCGMMCQAVCVCARTPTHGACVAREGAARARHTRGVRR